MSKSFVAKCSVSHVLRSTVFDSESIADKFLTLFSPARTETRETGGAARHNFIELASAGWEGYFEMLQAVVERGLPAAYRPSAAHAHWPRRLRRLPADFSWGEVAGPRVLAVSELL